MSNIRKGSVDYMKVREFKSIKFKRDNEYFKDGYASWEINHKNQKFFVNAIYGKQALEHNSCEEDCFNGIKCFELTNSRYKCIKKFDVPKKAEIFDLGVIENFITSYF